MSNDSERIKVLEKMQMALEEEQKEVRKDQEHFKSEVHAYVEENRNDHDIIRIHVSNLKEDMDEIKDIARNNSKSLGEISNQQTETKLLIARFKGAFGVIIFLFTSVGVAAKIGWEWFKAHK